MMHSRSKFAKTMGIFVCEICEIYQNSVTTGLFSDVGGKFCSYINPGT